MKGKHIEHRDRVNDRIGIARIAVTELLSVRFGHVQFVKVLRK